MPSSSVDGRQAAEKGKPVGNPDYTPWLFLLIIPVVLPLLPMIYNKVDPTLFGIPFFYWFQLAMVFVSAGITGLVYARSRRGNR